MKLKSPSNRKQIIYLDNACMGLVSERVLTTVKESADRFCYMTVPPTQLTVNLYKNIEKCRESIAILFNANSEEICLIESTTHGLGLIAQSLPIEKNNNIVICDLEFVSDVLCWQKRQQEIGFEIRRVRTKNGHPGLEDFCRAVDSRTKAIVVSSVQEINGFRTDIKALAGLARQYGAYLIVDGIQEAGALKVDLQDTGVDVYCTGGHKWLRNPFGTGFMYIRRDVLGELEPGFYGYFNAVSPDGDWQAYLESPKRSPFDNLTIAQSASKFETGGTMNYLGITGLSKNVELIMEYGIENIENRIKQLNRYLLMELKKRNLQILSSDVDIHRSGICTFHLDNGISHEKALVDSAYKAGVFISLRYVSGIGGIRISPHYYNRKEEIDRLLEFIDKH
jgi:selenocysteine lyase/cysteine desulfurase